jgi:glycosyltransferase involved in cell wall biosynthesis
MGRIWDEAKNIDLLVRAAKDLKYKIYIAGKAGKEKPKANSRIEILGQLSKEDIAKYLSAASVFVLPARYEPFGLSALEAGLSGCALVLGDISSLREIWNDNAVFVNTDDPEMLVGTIHSLMRDTSELHKYAAKAYEHAKTYTVQKMASGYSTLYSQLKQEKQEKAYTL